MLLGLLCAPQDPCIFTAQSNAPVPTIPIPWPTLAMEANALNVQRHLLSPLKQSGLTFLDNCHALHGVYFQY